MKKSSYRIAILFDADLDNRKGMTNAVLERITYLKKYLPQEIEFDVICISYYFGTIIRLFKQLQKQSRISDCVINDIHIKIRWRKFYITDYLLKKLGLSPVFAPIQNKLLSKELIHYDLISAHSYICAEIAYQAYSKYNIPYYVTWHGSDIHTQPFQNAFHLNRTKVLIENADINYFVSRALLNQSEDITTSGKKEVSYNGVSYNFHRYDDSCKMLLRKKYNIDVETKIIAFVGNLIPIKNAQYLPDIFYQIIVNTSHKVLFWIIGDGKLRTAIEEKINTLGISSKVCMFGNVPYENMPDLMNCIDLLLLPSINEGLPLVTVEASRCGAMVVGSDAGGIPEAIGKEHTVVHGDKFIERFANKCISVLSNKEIIFINDKLDWDYTAQNESVEIVSILQRINK